MKKLTLERVVPTMPASVSWLIFGMTVWGDTFLSEVRQKQENSCQPSLAGVE
jgi:hypothetical protein